MDQQLLNSSVFYRSRNHIKDVIIKVIKAYLPLCFFVEAKKLSRTFMNKNISGVVVRGIVLIII